MPQSNKISEITTYFSKGFQRVNRFEVSFSRFSKTFWASECQIPEQAIVYFPETFSPSGPSLNVPLKRTYDDRFLISFIVEADWEVRKYFEQWYDAMFSSVMADRSSTVQYRDNNLSTVSVRAISDNATSVNATFTLYEAFPRLILPSQFTNDVPNQYLSLTVDMGYRYYRLT